MASFYFCLYQLCTLRGYLNRKNNWKEVTTMKAIVVILILLLGCTVAAYQGVQPLASTKDKVINWIETKTSNATTPTQPGKTTEPSKASAPTKPATIGIVGKWQHTELKNQYMEFFKDGRLVFDDGQYMISGTYELISNEYIKVSLEGIAGAFAAMGGAETWKYRISGDTMTITAAGKSSILRRVR